MRLYDAMLQKLSLLMEGVPCIRYCYAPDRLWPEKKEYEMIFQSETALELGSGKSDSCNITCVTDNPEFFNGDEVWVYGKELNQMENLNPCGGFLHKKKIKQNNTRVCYARISEILIRPEGPADSLQTEGSILKKHGAPDTSKEEKNGESDEKRKTQETDRLYRLMQEIDFVKYHVYPEGVMLRTSGQSVCEQLRVGKKAINDGISFEKLGNTFIRHYKENPAVLNVRMLFITAESVDYETLQKEAEKAVTIRNSLSKLRKGLPTECSICDIREICSEIEGLRELHFGR